MSKCNQEERTTSCACSYPGCERRGKCCECVAYHLVMNELPGCAFAKLSSNAERSYNRSFEYFARLVSGKQ